MGEPFDLDALLAEQRGEPFTFRFGGEVFELPANMDIRAGALIDSGQVEAGLKMMFGDAQWARVMASPAVFDHLTLQALLGAYLNHSGVSLGEFAASIASSPTTAKRSRPTSNGSTRSRSPR